MMVADGLVVVVRLIASLVVAIKDAVGTVKQNKEDCQEIAERVCALDTDLSSLNHTEPTKHQALSSALEGLRQALHQALQVVMDCQDESTTIFRHANAAKMSEKLRKANEHISNQIQRVTLVACLHNNIIAHNTLYSQHGVRPEESYLVNCREEEGTSPILSCSNKLDLSELKVATKNFSDENVISESASCTVDKGKKYGRPSLGANAFPLETESLSSIRARSTSSSLQIQMRDEPARELRAELEANRQETQQMRQEMEAMAARNTSLEESQRQMQETMQAQMQAIANMFRANGMTVPEMPTFGAMVIHSPNTANTSAASSNTSPMSQTHGPAGPTPPPSGA